MKTAMTIAAEAGALLREGYGTARQFETKSTDIDLVTEYDHAAEALITRRLRAAFPDHLVLGEEGTRDEGASAGAGSTPTWIIDPLDGTGNFSHAFPVFAVSLALWQGNEPLAGVVYDPLRDETFHAARGHGAWLAAGGQPARRLQTSAATELLHSLLATGFPYDRHTSDQDNLAQFAAFLKRARGLRRCGAAALDLAYVAAGRLDGYWEYKLSSWDVAAGVLLVQEAGGRVTAIDGDPFQLDAHVDMIASNGKIHAAMEAVIARVAAPATLS
ncbi:MAG: inositol monophosphatase family protein [Anaerolineae bacterium]|nr:inositol monophosphatase family protein [Anaerolineae bacterium]